MTYSSPTGDKNPEGDPTVEVRPRNDNSNPQQGTGGVMGKGTETVKGIEKVKDKEKEMVEEKGVNLPGKPLPELSPVLLSDNEGTASDNLSVTNLKTSSSNNKTQIVKKDCRKLFVGGLPADVTDKEFSEFFGQFGVVLDSVVMYDRETHRSRGFGFVTFQDPDVAARLLSMGHGLDHGNANEDKKSQPSTPITQQQPKVGRLEMRGKICEVKAAEPKESRLSRNRPQFAGQMAIAAGSTVKNANGNNSTNIRHSVDSHSHRTPKGFGVPDESMSGAPAGVAMGVVPGAGHLAPNGAPLSFSYPPHYSSHDISGVIGPHGHGGPSSYYHPSLHGMHPNAHNVGHYMGTPLYNQMVFPFHHGEMAQAHHNGVFMVPPPVFGTHMADGFGMYMDGSIVEGHQHFLPPHHNPYWNMMHHQHHHLQVHHSVSTHHPSQHGPSHGVHHHRQHAQHPQQPMHSNNNINNVPYHSVSSTPAQSSVMHRATTGTLGKQDEKNFTKENKNEEKVTSSVA